VAKKHGVSEQTIYVWRRRYGKMEVADDLPGFFGPVIPREQPLRFGLWSSTASL